MIKYSKSMRFFHWFLFLIILCNIIGGLLMKYLPNESINKLSWYSIHKSIGVCVILIVFLRVINRLFSKIPKFIYSVPLFDRIAAKINIFLLYCCMLIVPISGFVMSDSGKYGVKVFGMKMPNLLPKNAELAGIAHEVHCYANYVFIALIIFHLLGTLKHILIDKINILKRIT